MTATAALTFLDQHVSCGDLSPFGGCKRSGVGRESGQETIEDDLQVKSVWISTATTVPNPFIQR